jgi:glutathionylspermidine synthase
MKRIEMAERPDWKKTAEEQGFTFHSMHGEPYWDETSAYEFSLSQIENDIEDPSTELHAMCRDVVEKITSSQELMEKLDIPEPMRDYVADSWRNGEPELYGRFDLIYDGRGPAKMIEYNADTPTSLFEASAFQWTWLEEQVANGVLPEGADQFNRTYEALSERFAELFAQDENVHFSSVNGEELPEDFATVETMAWAAKAGGIIPHYTQLEKIGISEDGQFCDSEARVIGAFFKLYPWEDMLRDDFAEHLPASNCKILEPAWKAIVSNKGMLPVLWEMFEGHPNLLPSFFAEDVERGTPLVRRAQDALTLGSVRKPLFSREGASITITENGSVTEEAQDRSYDAHRTIIQAYHPLPVLGGFRPILGAWMVAQTCVGLGIREDRSKITQDLSRFKPHYILD